ncbi:NAD(P)H dehydrogenase [Pseudomonas sp. 250J]|uniref:NAD(P)H-dependent oxidoreductase n=1 Tax=Pseudomonas peradeniyensis TaxID=2745488 RepID=A0A923G739_9PSED|nr:MULTISPECIES: NAD(P)H-dependent oxidoreductase [Pseudomonas]KNX77482.1 NAD(P)H dehydrogenase [Pseudomonas sp. 250J]MBV4504063.1 NAD(P)H-dependent oxidoreductase [Pseudomonas peradeniyensis]MCU7240019.1 NAD(P)H-dependent oxidoreductase [Pseudomonas peradeniyensis]MCU7280888.1 NAD(P)H-dependent oxidoreductase [Pseudomonas peradeniyensis]QZA56430.1 NAD(P)H-dependent oxidoreductase [Pseudomonas sp. 2hn]
MHALIVIGHHDPDSLTHALAQQIAEGLRAAGHTSEFADLASEGFDPRFGLADHAVHRRLGKPPADVLAEQARIERADTVVMVYPIYWWSLPALLKGWVERVFSNGWAFDQAADGSTTKLLHGMTAHLVGVAGADAGTFERHGYGEAMRVQIEHGIFDYCGARVLSSTLLEDSEGQDPTRHLRSARALGERLFVSERQAVPVV